MICIFCFLFEKSLLRDLTDILLNGLIKVLYISLIKPVIHYRIRGNRCPRRPRLSLPPLFLPLCVVLLTSNEAYLCSKQDRQKLWRFTLSLCNKSHCGFPLLSRITSSGRWLLPCCEVPQEARGTVSGAGS